MRNLIGRAAAAVFLVVLQGLAPASHATVVYSNDFEGAVGAEWSSTTTETTPVGGRNFLGRFRNEQVMLSLSGLPTHSAISLSFDFLVIQSWDGNDATFGADVWEVGVVGGSTLLSATFTNVEAFTQSYPDPYPAGSNPAMTGAAEVDTLGYVTVYGDSVYTLSFTFAHSGSSLDLFFSGLGMNTVGTTLAEDTERWGLDNITIAAVPEPATVYLLLSTLLLLVLTRALRVPLRTGARLR
jgi:hypothetical protein